MERALSIVELINRPIIRNDKPYEFLNKMTDEELKQWDDETVELLREENVKSIFPDWNAAYLAKMIDSQILYELFVKGYDYTKNKPIKNL